MFDQLLRVIMIVCAVLAGPLTIYAISTGFAGTPGSGTIDARVNYDNAFQQFSVVIPNSLDWTQVKLVVNDTYSYSVNRIAAGQLIYIPANGFTDSAGKRPESVIQPAHVDDDYLHFA